MPQGIYTRTEDCKKILSLAHMGKKCPWSSKTQTNNYRGNSSLKRKERIAGRPKPDTCEVCGAGGQIMYDHDHKTGKFRGWICRGCNSSLGFARDRVEVLEKLIDYLNFHGMFQSVENEEQLIQPPQ